MFSLVIQRLHELAWQPGKWMDAAWWPYLGLSNWQDSYQRYPSCRPILDKLIIKQRQFPAGPLPGEVDDKSSALITWEPKLPRLVISLGLIALGCQDYLRFGRYRRVLTPILGTQGCDQLLALYSNWRDEPAQIDEDSLVTEATRFGLHWLSENTDNIIHQALVIKLPPCDPVTLPTPGEAAFPILTKLARFL